MPGVAICECIYDRPVRIIWQVEDVNLLANVEPARRCGDLAAEAALLAGLVPEGDDREIAAPAASCGAGRTLVGG